MAKTNITAPTLSSNNIKNFWRHVDKETPYGPRNDCWRWTGATNNKGYGTFGVRHNQKNRYLTPHRVSYFIATGIWTEKVVRHSCDVYDCVNPAHLLVGTHKQNTQDALDRGRLPIGERHYNAIMTEGDVRRTRELAKVFGISETARQMGIKVGTAFSIIHRKSWKHVD